MQAALAFEKSLKGDAQHDDITLKANFFPTCDYMVDSFADTEVPKFTGQNHGGRISQNRRTRQKALRKEVC